MLSSVAFAGLSLTTSPAPLTALVERRPEGANAGSIMGWYTGAIAVGYAVAGFVGGAVGDAVGPGNAIRALAVVPLVAGAALALVVARSTPERIAEPERRGAWWRDFHGLPGAVWLAFFVTLSINLVSGVVLTFLPIYGLAIGLSLTQVGVLQGVHGGAAAVVRSCRGSSSGSSRTGGRSRRWSSCPAARSPRSRAFARCSR